MTMVTLYPHNGASEYQWIAPIGLGIKVPMNNPHWFGYQNTNERPYWFGYQSTNERPPLAGYQSTNEQPPLVWVLESIHSQFVHNHIYEIIVSNKNISYPSTYIYIYIYTYIIIYSVFKYICDISIFFTLNQYS